MWQRRLLSWNRNLQNRKKPILISHFQVTKRTLQQQIVARIPPQCNPQASRLHLNSTHSCRHSNCRVGYSAQHTGSGLGNKQIAHKVLLQKRDNQCLHEIETRNWKHCNLQPARVWTCECDQNSWLDCLTRCGTTPTWSQSFAASVKNSRNRQFVRQAAWELFSRKWGSAFNPTNSTAY